jgi:hypothetical protein
VSDPLSARRFRDAQALFMEALATGDCKTATTRFHQGAAMYRAALKVMPGREVAAVERARIQAGRVRRDVAATINIRCRPEWQSDRDELKGSRSRRR